MNFANLERLCTHCNGTGDDPVQKGFLSYIAALPCTKKCSRGYVLTEDGVNFCKFLARHMNYDDAQHRLYLKREELYK
jgi:Tryptophan RNA-binding attenuator protein inhibitory protein